MCVFSSVFSLSSFYSNHIVLVHTFLAAVCCCCSCEIVSISAYKWYEDSKDLKAPATTHTWEYMSNHWNYNKFFVYKYGTK